MKVGRGHTFGNQGRSPVHNPFAKINMRGRRQRQGLDNNHIFYHKYTYLIFAFLKTYPQQYLSIFEPALIFPSRVFEFFSHTLQQTMSWGLSKQINTRKIKYFSCVQLKLFLIKCYLNGHGHLTY